MHRWDDLQGLLEGGWCDWSCGTRKTIPIQSRVFLLKQGPEPRGIVASGFTVSPVKTKKHWDAARARKGAKQNYVDIRFDTVLGPDPDDILHRPLLDVGPLKLVNWNTQMSGIVIPDVSARALERLWLRFASGRLKQMILSNVRAVENTLTETRRYTRKRDRSLRQQALVQARGTCEACCIKYGDYLDGLGGKVLQVHHRRQLAASDAPRLTNIRELAVVCANCHSLIHANSRRAISVERLRRLLSNHAV